MLLSPTYFAFLNAIIYLQLERKQNHTEVEDSPFRQEWAVQRHWTLIAFPVEGVNMLLLPIYDKGLYLFIYC